MRRVDPVLETHEIESLTVGQESSFRLAFDQEDLEAFARLSGDVNPLHSDDAYASSIGFKERVVYGLLTTSALSRLVGVHMPGRYSLIRDVTVQFPNPLYVGEEIEVSGAIERLDVEKRLMTLKVSATRVSDGAKVLRGKVALSMPNPRETWRTGFDAAESRP